MLIAIGVALILVAPFLPVSIRVALRVWAAGFGLLGGHVFWAFAPSGLVWSSGAKAVFFTIGPAFVAVGIALLWISMTARSQDAPKTHRRVGGR